MMTIYIPGEGANNPLGLYKSTDFFITLVITSSYFPINYFRIVFSF